MKNISFTPLKFLFYSCLILFLSFFFSLQFNVVRTFTKSVIQAYLHNNNILSSFVMERKGEEENISFMLVKKRLEFSMECGLSDDF